MNIQEFRKRYPQYDDLDDQQLATAIHQKFYSDLPQEQVFTTLGFTPKPVAEPFTMPPEEMVDPEAALVLGATPFAPTKPTQAPEKPEKPMGYSDVLDDAVNYLQEGVPEAQVKRIFEGVEWEDISARAKERGMFVPTVLEEYTPEQVAERVKKYGELKGTPETDFAQDPAKWTAEAFTNVGKRTGANYRDVATSFLVQSGGIDPIDAALTLKENARRRSAAAPSLAIQEGMQEIGASETYGEAVSAMFKNPRATFTMLVDSIATSVPLLAPALIVAPAGVPAAAAAAFVGSAGLEYGSVMADVLQDKGVDLTDALSIDKALRDPKIMNEIKEKGAKRGLIVGGFDALTMGLAGKFLRPVNELIGAGKLSGDAAKRATIAAWGKELAVQTGGGAAGEFLAQKATGEDRPADVLLEALAGGATAPLEAMSALREAREIEEGRAPPPAPKGPARIEPTPGPAPTPVTAPVTATVTPQATPEPESAFAELTFDDEEAAPPAAPTPPAAPPTAPAAITPPAPPVQPPAEPSAPPAPSQPPVATAVPETAPATTPEGAPKEPEFVLQNRDRSGTASVQQMESIARAPDYSRAGFSRTADGAPIISMATVPENQLGRVDNVTTPRGRKIPVQYAVVEADDIITSNDISGRPNPVYGDQNIPGARAIAGNGRVTGLRESFNLGTSNKYVEEMTNDSDLHGVSPEVISKMNKPVLVRVMPNESLTKDIGDELNLSEKLELSPIEQAKNDLNRVDFETLQFDEDGEITNQSLAQFINAQPVEERAKLVDRNLPTKQARQRLENAIFARAYKDDDLIAMFAQTDDPEAKLVISALAQVAPQMAKLEGAGNLDIREIVSDAAKIIISGKRKGLKLVEIASQIDMTVDPDTRIIVSLFAQNPRSNKAAIEALRTAADVAYQESIKPEEGLFGVEPKRERREILEEARDTYEPTGKKDVEAAKGAGTAPRDAEGKAQPSPDGVPPEDQGIQVQQPTKSLGLDFDAPEQPRRTTKQEREAEGFRLMPGPAPERSGTNLDLFGTEGLSQLPPPSQLAKRKRENARQLGLFEDSPLPPNEDNSAGESARRDAVSTVDDLQSTDTILGLALTDDYAARQRASLVGQKINNYEDLAVLSQVYRHPRFETFRLFFTDKDGKIISQLGVTSRLPGSASVIVGNDVDRYVDLVQTAAIGAGATGFWMLHNHPSGNTEFSNADLLLTKGYEKKFKNLTFNGHIVLDTNKFGVIDRGQNVLQINRDMGQKDLIKSLGDYRQVFNVVDMAKKIDENPDSTVIVSVNSAYQVVGITTINNSDVIGKTPSQVTRYLQKLAISNMGGRIAVATRNKAAFDAVASNVEDGLLINPDGSYKTFRDIYRGLSFLFPSFRPGVTTADTSKLFNFLRIPKSPVNTLKFNQADLRVLEPEQEDLFGKFDSEEESPPGIIAPKKLPPGRSRELSEAAAKVKSGEMSALEYDALVNKYKPIPVYDEPMRPASQSEVIDALDKNKKDKVNPDIPNGTPVGLRLDIPAFNRKGVFVVSIHQKRTPSAVGKVIGYGSVAKITDVTFAPGNQKKALDIATGEAKDVLQTMEGKYVNITPEQAYEDAKRAIKDPSYVQVGVDPTRHAYFFDRRTTMPIIGASEVIQIGNMILAKNPVYDSKQNFIYDVDTTIDQPRSAQDEETLQSTREDIIREYAALRRRRTELVKQIKRGQASIDLQRELTLIDERSREYKEAIEASAERRDSAEAFFARALQEFDKGNIDAEVLAVIQAAYIKAPRLLEGLLLSVRALRGERGVAGSFDPFNRIIALYKGTSGIRNAGTFLHELSHTLEQMMTPEQRIALLDAWRLAIKKAMRKHLAPGAKDREKFQNFFDAVQRFMNDPSEENRAKAIKLLPGRDFYQFISPSEFWAVNAEKLMATRLGSGWERFKAAIRRLFEGLKKVFGFDNRYDVHQVFRQVAYGDLSRDEYSVLEDMIVDDTYEERILRNLPDDVDDYMSKYDRPDTPYETSTPVKDALLGSAQAASQAAKNAATNPLGTASKLIGSVDRGLTAVQNEFVWFGSGLDAADFSRYNGQLRDGYGRLAASAYATQAMHAGHVGTQVINRGKLIFNAKTQLFQAAEDQYSMANVVRLKAEIIKLLGEQRSANLVNTYFEAKRARSIQNEYQRVEANYQNATTPEAKSDLWEELQQIIRAYDKIPSSFLKKDPNGDIAEVDVTGPNNKKISVAIVDDTAIDEAIDFEIQVPQLRDMMTNWTAVNRNMLDNMRLAGILSKERHQKLKSIKDYVPWYRVMDDNMDIHEPTGGAVRGLSGVPRERRFGKGRTERAVDDIVDNMLHNVLLLTKSTMRNYANNRIIQNYAARDAKGRIKLAKREGPLPNGSVGVKALINGRRVTVEITDPLVAAASIGMENIDLPVNEILGTLTNAFRRGITLDPFFQLAQIIKDAPGAAWVTGVRNPLALIGGVFESFVMALNPNDPVTQTLKSYGIGGFQSLSRSPERQLKIDIGLLNKSNFARALDILDRIGDASDFAQRRAIYNRVLKETGDETQALLQANNIIDFMKRGGSRSAQFVSRYVAFANAYAQSINVLAQALAGGGLKGMSRKRAQARILKTGALLAGLSTLYAMSVAGSEEYEELDDQTRLRNIVIPGSKAIFGEAVLIPMNTSAAFLFKALPELTYNKIVRDGTETEMDATRLKKALAEAAADSLLGPNIVPSAIKPAIEVALNKNFWTGSTVVPRGLEKFESAEQYNAATSELAKTLSGLTEVGDKRLLSPIEFDHMIRGMFGTAGYLSMYASNMLAAERPDPRLRDTPGLGRFFAGPVGRKNEELFYDLKERVDKKYSTLNVLIDRSKDEEIDKILDKNSDLIEMHTYISAVDARFKEINSIIRQIGENIEETGPYKEKREEITDLQRQKSEILDDIEMLRKDAGL